MKRSKSSGGVGVGVGVGMGVGMGGTTKLSNDMRVLDGERVKERLQNVESKLDDAERSKVIQRMTIDKLKKELARYKGGGGGGGERIRWRGRGGPPPRVKNIDKFALNPS